MKIWLNVWRQMNPQDSGRFDLLEVGDVSEDMSFLEMLDVVNERLTAEGKDPIAFDHDCREGICGSCGIVIDGRPHGPKERTTTCQLHMRSFRDGASITLEPWRAGDRSAFDRIIASGGFVSAPTGSAVDGNALPIEKENADLAMDAAACIGCGACVAACPNASAMLFTSAKVSQLALLPQGQPERWRRVVSMVSTMDAEGFGSCTNHGECMSACPKSISLDHIARMNRDWLAATLREGRRVAAAGDSAAG
jgi:succinate dehydrogenase / fumarate reductase iron-sulfur subunit